MCILRHQSSLTPRSYSICLREMTPHVYENYRDIYFLESLMKPMILLRYKQSTYK